MQIEIEMNHIKLKFITQHEEIAIVYRNKRFARLVGCTWKLISEDQLTL